MCITDYKTLSGSLMSQDKTNELTGNCRNQIQPNTGACNAYQRSSLHAHWFYLKPNSCYCCRSSTMGACSFHLVGASLLQRLSFLWIFLIVETCKVNLFPHPL